MHAGPGRAAGPERPEFEREVTAMPGEEDLLYRQMPHNLEAEQAVLGSMLIDQNCI